MCGVRVTFRQVQKRAVRRERLVGEDVETCPCEPPVPKGVDQGVVVEDARSRGVDHVGGRLHERQLTLADERLSLLRGRVQGHHVRTPEEIVERDCLDPCRDQLRLGHERVVHENAHAEGGGLGSHTTADCPEPEQAKAQSGELRPFVDAIRDRPGRVARAPDDVLSLPVRRTLLGELARGDEMVGVPRYGARRSA